MSESDTLSQPNGLCLTRSHTPGHCSLTQNAHASIQAAHLASLYAELDIHLPPSAAASNPSLRQLPSSQPSI
eukprot:769468-Rhodomonas_salina.2